MNGAFVALVTRQSPIAACRSPTVTWILAVPPPSSIFETASPYVIPTTSGGPDVFADETPAPHSPNAPAAKPAAPTVLAEITKFFTYPPVASLSGRAKTVNLCFHRAYGVNVP